MHGTVYIADAVNWDSSLNRGLVSWWRALPDQQRGNVFRDLTGRNHGALTNAPTWTGALGRPGGHGSLYADGFANPSQHVAASATTLSAYTFGLWAKLSGSVSASLALMQNHTLYARPSFDTFRVQFNGGAFPTQDSTVIPSSNVWYQITVTYAGTSAGDTKLYLYGQDITAGTTVAIPAPNTTGITFPRGGAFAGQIMHLDDVFLYSRALSASEVTALYQDSLRGNPETLNWHRPRRFAPEQAGGGGATAFPWHYYQQLMAG